MEKFTHHSGVTATLLQPNIDTDAIIPSREMKLVSKQGLGEGLFAYWRYTEAGGREPNPEFILNQSSYANTSILLTGVNFGCGSSREHAVWALSEYGIRAIIAPSFGAIFYGNCVRNGILPIVLDEDHVKNLARAAADDTQNHQLSIDLESCVISTPDGNSTSFEIEESHRHMLLNGLDSVALTQQLESTIREFEASDKINRSWLY
ncbi:MAG: 3-isopropylmalate dehydratase small subunit [Pseudomonadales bacterium]